MPKATAAPETETRTLLITSKGGELKKVEIPKDWAVTYGPIVVGARNEGGNSPNVLRLYSDSSKKSLMAVFRDVVDFVDESINVRVRVVKAKNKTFTRQEANGEQKYSARVEKVTWRDPHADVQPDDDDDTDLTESVLAIPAGMDE